MLVPPYHVTFIGRTAGAIGIFYPIKLTLHLDVDQDLPLNTVVHQAISAAGYEANQIKKVSRAS